MRAKIVFIPLILLGLVALFVRDAQWARRWNELAAVTGQLNEERAALVARTEQLEAKLQEIESRRDPNRREPIGSSRADATLDQAVLRITRMESQLNALAAANSSGPPGASNPRVAAALLPVPEYDPTQPPPAPSPSPSPTVVQAVEPRVPERRGFGPEQATGPPDTDRAGDIETAWATREPNVGAEWLWVGFDRPVELAQVRVRETYNPGAIIKITAVVNGREALVWQGTASGGRAPRDFVVNAPGGIVSQAVIVHLDTTRVSGWNEIDVVELVGRDGSRQWASQADASTTFASGSPARAITVR